MKIDEAITRYKSNAEYERTQYPIFMRIEPKESAKI
jgi:hypothetical protein